MLPTAIRPGSPSLSVSDAIATASQPTPHHRTNTSSYGAEALQSQERAASNDPKYRKYAQQVEKTLATFEHVNEWADFITFLAKLLKCLQSAPQYPFIPHKLTVAKRLSQCLNPALPTGVHQRALDVYVHILTTIGSENLRRDLPAWTSGLLPFFQYAATSIKPMVLSIFDRFYLPLHEALRPATKAFILALLPGLDEEASEWFEQVATLLDRLCETVSPSFFLPNIWLVLITTPQSRVSALNYLLRRMHLLLGPVSNGTAAPSTPVVEEREDGSGTVLVDSQYAGHDLGLMVRGYAAALEDDQVLVQRGALDLLISTLPVSSAAFQRLTSDDKVLLVHACLPVVLRRDLSLTRRLHTWLLGASDASHNQMSHLRKHVLESLRVALVEDIQAREPSSDVTSQEHELEPPYDDSRRRQISTRRQRAFKIFISLLDKWEIGAPLTEVAVLDAFAAVQAMSEKAKSDTEEASLTAQLLYDALDPMLLWRQIYRTVQEALCQVIGTAQSPDRVQATRSLELVRFLVSTFKIRGEEVQRLYAPLVAFSTLAQIAAADRLNEASGTGVLVAAASLARDLLATTNFDSLFGTVAEKGITETDPSEGASPSITRSPAALAHALFDNEHDSVPNIDGLQGRTLAVDGLTATLQIIQNCCRHRSHVPLSDGDESDPASGKRTQDSDSEFDRLCLMSSDIFGRLSKLLSSPTPDIQTRNSLLARTEWSPERWIQCVLQAIEQVPARLGNFALHESLLVTSLEASGAGWLSGAPHKRRLAAVGGEKLLDYLESSVAPCSMTSADLIWRLDALSPSRMIESLIAERLSAEDVVSRIAGYEAFGNLWRCTSDQRLPGRLMTTPMFAVLDGLKAENLTTRRLAEAWMRCSLKSYLRVLDPILFVLADPRYLVNARLERLGEVRVPLFSYAQAIDQDQMQHALDSLLSLARFGGQGFIRVAKASFLKHSFDPALRQRVLQADLDTSTYLDGIVTLLLRFLCASVTTGANPEPGPSRRQKSPEAHIHGLAAEILQVILSRGEAEISDLESIEAALLCRLYTSVQAGQFDLQNKMLHVLHTAVHASRLPPASARRQHQSEESSAYPGTAGELLRGSQVFIPPDFTFETFFVRTVRCALAQDDNAVVHHWLDFLLMTVPHSRYEASEVLDPVIDDLIMRLRTCVNDLERMFAPHPPRDLRAAVTDAEFAALVNALERLLLLALAKSTGSASDVPSTGRDAKQVAEGAVGSGPAALFGYVTGVLGHAESETTGIHGRTRPDSHHLTEAVAALLTAWNASYRLERAPRSVVSDTRDHTAARIRLRAKRAMERFLKSHNTAVIHALVKYWSTQYNVHKALSTADNDLAEIIQALLPSPAGIVTAVYESVAAKAPSTKTGRNDQAQAVLSFVAARWNLSPLAFLEYYITRIEPASTIQLWNQSLTFAREILANQANSRSVLLPTTRVFTALCLQVSRTRALEDRRVRRDLQETLSRLVDSTVQVAGRAPDSSGWLRKGVKDEAVPDDASSAHDDERREDEKSSITENEKALPDHAKPVTVQEVVDFLSSHILPNFEVLSIEPERASAICANIVYYLVGPAFKVRGRNLDVPAANLRMLQQMSKNVAVLKAWKGIITDAFADNRFFQSSPSTERLWRPLVHAITLADRERVPELIAKVSTSSSANIFTNRELEILSRALALRRLTYTIFCSPKDTFLAQLPAIQEKLVDLLRSSVGDLVHVEVYLCLRVLLCRIDNQHLAGLWPVLLTELLRLFDSLFDRTIPDESDLLQLVSSACKFIDLALVLQAEDFQIHEWIFVTDTVDAASPSDTRISQAIIDRLGDLSPTDGNGPPIPLPTEMYRMEGRRPLLTTRYITSMGALQPFLRHVSLAAYQSLYHAGTRIDWPAVERSLINDLFEGPDATV
ncbi:hypothetical protein JCM10908_002290 [Rhodotorula pacifica]|uniref:Dop1p n=1 Tax=Rhodotorula pacifica TaxID=1495444 RepID=UPI00317DDBC7